MYSALRWGWGAVPLLVKAVLKVSSLQELLHPHMPCLTGYRISQHQISCPTLLTILQTSGLHLQPMTNYEESQLIVRSKSAKRVHCFQGNSLSLSNSTHVLGFENLQKWWNHNLGVGCLSKKQCSATYLCKWVHYSWLPMSLSSVCAVSAVFHLSYETERDSTVQSEKLVHKFFAPFLVTIRGLRFVGQHVPSFQSPSVSLLMNH